MSPPTPSLRLNKIQLLLLVAGLFFSCVPMGGAKSNWETTSCQSLALLDPQIKYCSDNEKARVSALACSTAILKAWNEASLDLSALRRGFQNSQNLNFENTDEKYELAIERIESLVALTKRNTDTIAQYPTVMVDGSGMKDFRESLSCFREPYEAIQITVTSLDKKVAEARKVLKSAQALHRNLRKVANAMESELVSERVGVSSAPLAAPPPSSPRKPAPSRSSITGVKEHAGIN